MKVALLLDRSIEMMIVLLGVIKSGAAYVPIEPRQPTARINEILKDANASLCVTTTPYAQVVTEVTEMCVLDIERGYIQRKSIDSICSDARVEDLFCVMYTSGSTGLPKGVCIPMIAVLSRVRAMWRLYPFVEGDRAIVHRSYALIGSSWDCFGPLLKGVPTVIVPYEEASDPVTLWRCVVKKRISLMAAAPIMWQCLVEEAEKHCDEAASLRLCRTGGDVLSVELAKRWMKSFPNATLLNVYAATECISALLYDVSTLEAGAELVPAGRPLSGVDVFAVDEQLQPVANGETGELCVAGPCLALGYLNLPELTAQRFVPCSIASQSGDVMFRTGDIGRQRQDGAFEVLGRVDHQVKIKGYRIELGEVEAALRVCPGVRRAVAAVEQQHGGARLVAYVEFTSDDASSVDLRRALRNRLPMYMMPSEIVRTRALPLTSSGKIDRKALGGPRVIA
jgi:surfactin family lipopeptide synthetase A